MKLKVKVGDLVYRKVGYPKTSVVTWVSKDCRLFTVMNAPDNQAFSLKDWRVMR